MARQFRRSRRGIDVGLAPEELAVCLHFLDQVSDFLEPPAGDAGSVEIPQWASDLGLTDLDGDVTVATPADPALARLLPDASPDELLAADFRRLSEGGLRQEKQRCIRAARTALARGLQGARNALDDAEAVALLRALTDVRLVLAERLGIVTDADAERLHGWLEEDDDAAGSHAGSDDEDAAQRWLARAYEFLTWLQESLAEVLLPQLPTEGDGRRQPPPTG